MSYFIWMLLSRGSRSYPTGIAWLILSILRVFDYVAITGICIFLAAQTMGFAVDARTWLHYKVVQSEYNLSEMDTNDKDGINSANYENFKAVEKQRALFGWYGKYLVIEESVYDKWRGLFNNQSVNMHQWSLTPFFWNFGGNDVGQSVNEIDFSYTILGLDGLKDDNNASWDKGYMNLINSYALTDSTLVANISGNPLLNTEAKEKYETCSAAIFASDVPYIGQLKNNDAIKSNSIDEVISKFKTDKDRYKQSKECLIQSQLEMGLKPYPTQEMLDYNDTIIAYRESLLTKAKERAEKNNESEVYLLQNWDKGWMDKVNALHNKKECEISINNEGCTGYTDYFKEGKPNSSMLINTAFYDVVIKGNDDYKD